MAIYHLSVKPMSRKGGRSATAAIAYRSAEKIHDLTSDEVFDYTRKRGVEHKEIVLPTSAAKLDINWARDRQELWNAAEMAEKRKDARVAREYEVALPHELKAEQRVELVRAFASELANRYGVAVDFAIHKPHRNGDERNTHAHIMTTTREITATGLGRKTDIELGDRDRGKKGLGSAAEEIEFIRARWGALTNEHLKEQQLEIRVDHRSLEAQGINREPTTHVGPAVSALERRGIETEVGKRISFQMAAAAQERLERAAELGKLEREKLQVRQSILDLSGDLKAAQQQRGISARIESPPAINLEEIRRQGREDWLTMRAQLAQEKTLTPAPETEREAERQMELTPEEAPQKAIQIAEKFDLEQIKRQGREANARVQQQIERERLDAQERERAQEKKRALERSHSRGRGLGRGPGRDDGLGR
jgi:MobA/MobL family